MIVKEIREEVISGYELPNNGSDLLWCFGSRTIARDGTRVFATVPETSRDVKPLCNTRWRLFCRREDCGWEPANTGEAFNEREPCPIVRHGNGRIIISANPAIRRRHYDSKSDAYYNDCKPVLLEFDALDPYKRPAAVDPVWDAAHSFTDHSYRGIAADPETGEILVLNVEDYRGQCWSYLDSCGRWSRNGRIVFPQRACYPAVAVREHSACVLAVSDIVEPNPEWKSFKYGFTGREWDYVFDKLYFTYTPDITGCDFSGPVTVEDCGETAGHLRHQDIWMDGNKDVHIIYLMQNINYKHMRDRYFPGVPITVSLIYCVIREGKLIEKRTLLTHTEGDTYGLKPGTGASLHNTGNGELYAVFYAMNGHGSENDKGADYIMRLIPGHAGEPERLELEHPLKNFFTASERTGTLPSRTVDIYGISEDGTAARYIEVKI